MQQDKQGELTEAKCVQRELINLGEEVATISAEILGLMKTLGPGNDPVYALLGRPDDFEIGAPLFQAVLTLRKARGWLRVACTRQDYRVGDIEAPGRNGDRSVPETWRQLLELAEVACLC